MSSHEQQRYPTTDEVLPQLEQILDKGYAHWVHGIAQLSEESNVDYAKRITHISKLDEEQQAAVGTLNPGDNFYFVIPETAEDRRAGYRLIKFHLLGYARDKNRRWVVARNIETGESKSFFPNEPVIVIEPGVEPVLPSQSDN